jgi:hypothetical protein
VQDRVKRAVDENIVRDIVFDKTKPAMPRQMRDVVGIAGDEVIHCDNGMIFRKKSFT